jgi:hypothetical protein
MQHNARGAAYLISKDHRGVRVTIDDIDLLAPKVVLLRFEEL